MKPGASHTARLLLRRVQFAVNQTPEESAPFLGLASPTDLFDCQAALPFLRARSSVEMLTPDCSAACW
jgi:hypothetical protein